MRLDDADTIPWRDRIEEKAPGPSPRVRGAGGDLVDQFAAHGTIPADAGSNWPPSPTRRAARDHPRGFGKQSTFGGLLRLLVGPSPRARGAGCHGQDPATVRWDHPRGCGYDEAPRGRRSRLRELPPAAAGTTDSMAALS